MKISRSKNALFTPNKSSTYKVAALLIGVCRCSNANRHTCPGEYYHTPTIHVVVNQIVLWRMIYQLVTIVSATPLWLLHSPSLVAVGLSVTAWSKYCILQTCTEFRVTYIAIYRLGWPVWISAIFQEPLAVPLHSPNDKQTPIVNLLAVRAVQRDCWRF